MRKRLLQELGFNDTDVYSTWNTNCVTSHLIEMDKEKATNCLRKVIGRHRMKEDEFSHGAVGQVLVPCRWVR